MKPARKERTSSEFSLEDRYVSALEEHVQSGNESTLRRAYDVGREAISEGKSLLEMATFHHIALRKILGRLNSDAAEKEALESARQFFAESISPYEMAHRGFNEAIAALRHLNEALEQEIRRIASAVHDEAGQLLTALHLTLAEISRDVPEPVRNRLGDLNPIFAQIEDQLRRLSHELRPTILDDLGCIPAIRFLADGVSRRNGIPIRVEASIEGRFPPAMETALYRIVQEALTNAMKHAQAKSVTIQFSRVDESICCSIRDDGVGFDVRSTRAPGSASGLGLIGIQERLNAMGGTLRILSSPGQGTNLLIRLPMEEQDANSNRTRGQSRAGLSEPEVPSRAGRNAGDRRGPRRPAGDRPD